MASTQKKGNSRKKTPAPPPPPAYNAAARMAGGIVCALLALCVLAASTVRRGGAVPASAKVTNWGLSFQQEGEPPVGNATAQCNLAWCYENGMGVSVGRLREDKVYDWKFVGLSHNTVRGAAGGAVLTAELLTAKKYITAK